MPLIISSVKVKLQDKHAVIDVFSRNEKAGTLTVLKEDGFDVAFKLTKAIYLECSNNIDWIIVKQSDIYIATCENHKDYWVHIAESDFISWEVWKYINDSFDKKETEGHASDIYNAIDKVNAFFQAFFQAN